MEVVFFFLKLFFIAFLIKLTMTWIYNIVFALLKHPYIYIAISFLFNIVAFEIIALFYSQSIDTRIFNMYGTASVIALFLLFPPKNDNISKEDLSEFSDEMLGINHSIVLYKVGLFAFFIGGILGSYLIMHQYGINILDTIKIGEQ